MGSFKIIICIYYWISLEVVSGLNITKSRWSHISELHGQLFETNKLSIHTVDNSYDCLIKCHMNPSCLSAVYNNISGFCQEYNAVFYDKSLSVENEGCNYYMITKDSCRSDGYTYSTDRSICYKVNPSMAYNYSDAESTCKSEGGHLLIIDTFGKQNDTAIALLSKSEWMNSEYYIDGSDSETESVWKFSTGALMPMTKEFWGGNNPDQSGNEDCVVMTTAFQYNFKWNDILCDRNKGYICERAVD